MKIMPSKKSVLPSLSSALDNPTIVEIKAGVFKNTCLELMDNVYKDRINVVITKHGKAVAKLVPPDSDGATAFGFLRGTVLKQDDIVSPDHSDWGDLA